VKAVRVDSGGPPQRPRGGKALVVLMSCVLLSFWVFGINSSAASENRLLASWPKVTPATVLDATTYTQADAAIKDRMAAKNAAVSMVSSGLEESPISYSPLVVLGEDAEPFLADDFSNPCLEDSKLAASTEKIEAAVEAHAAQVEAAGQYALFVVAPNKSSIRDEHLGPFGDSLIRCAADVRAQLEDWAAEPGSPFLAAWDRLEQAEQERPGDIYRHGDTHWSTVGASEYVRLIVERLVSDGEADPSILTGYDVVDKGTQLSGGDLYNLLGQTTRTEEVPVVAIERPGVVTTVETGASASGRGVSRWTSQSTGPALVPGRTLVIGDSFFEAADDLAAPFFEDLTHVISLDGDTPPDLAMIAGYDRIIVSQVERGWDAMARPYRVAGFF
jgi:hypothetical protein